jgi:hypothetical protein
LIEGIDDEVEAEEEGGTEAGKFFAIRLLEKLTRYFSYSTTSS